MKHPAWQRLRLAIASALGLLGLAALPAPTLAQGRTASREPFTVQWVERRSGLQFNANYGFVRVRYYRTQVQLNGKALKLRKAEGGTEDAFYDAFVLSEAPQPAVLVNHEGWQLVTEREGQAQVRVLTQGRVEGLRWAEGPADDRVISREYSHAEPPRTLELKGRRLLLLDDQTVFDIGSLALRRPGPPAATVPEGYTLALSDTLSVSPDRRALAQLYRGPSLSLREALVVVSDLDGSGQRQLLPLDLQALTGLKNYPPSAEPLLHYFEWVTDGGGRPTLRAVARGPAAAQGWRSEFQFGLAAPLSPQGQRLPRYRVEPARPTLLALVREHLIEHCNAEREPPQAGDPPAEHFVRMKQWVHPLLLRYEAETRSLVIESGPNPHGLWAQHTVRCAGEAVEAKLAEDPNWRRHVGR